MIYDVFKEPVHQNDQENTFSYFCAVLPLQYYFIYPSSEMLFSDTLISVLAQSSSSEKLSSVWQCGLEPHQWREEP